MDADRALRDPRGALTVILGRRLGHYLCAYPWQVPRGAGYWVAAFLFGAVLPSLVALLVVLPLKGRPMGGAWQLPLFVTAFFVNGAWGIGTGVFLKSLQNWFSGSRGARM